MAEHNVTFVDALWSSLKAWAKEQAALDASPSYDECAAEVRRISDELIGPIGCLRPEAVDYFAAEANEMIAKFRARAQAGNTGIATPENTYR